MITIKATEKTESNKNENKSANYLKKEGLMIYKEF